MQLEFTCQISPVWNQPFSSVLFIIIPQHSRHHGLCAHAGLPGFLSPEHARLQLHAHCGVAHPAVLGSDGLSEENAMLLQLMLLSQRLGVVSQFAAKYHYFWIGANTCLKRCQKLPNESYHITDIIISLTLYQIIQYIKQNNRKQSTLVMATVIAGMQKKIETGNRLLLFIV